MSQVERDDTETRPTLTTGSALQRTKEKHVGRERKGQTGELPSQLLEESPTPTKQAPTATPASRRNVESVFLIDPQSQRAAEVTQATTTEGQQQEGITEAETEGAMAHIDLKGNGSKALQRVRDSSTNETSANVFAKQATGTRQPLTQTATMGSEMSPVQALLSEFQRLEVEPPYDSAWVGPRKSPTLFYLAKFNHI